MYNKKVNILEKQLIADSEIKKQDNVYQIPGKLISFNEIFKKFLLENAK